MGTDIHLYVETRDKDGVWHSQTEPNPYYTPPEDRLAKAREYRQYSAALNRVPYDERPLIPESEAVAIANNPAEWSESPTRAVSRYDGRNYDLFAILAGVRNGEDTTPISDPRGIPEDASATYRTEAEDEWGHSHSWLTLAELLSHDWDGQKASNTALVHPNGFFRDSEGLSDDFDFDAFAAEVQGVLEQGGHDAMWSRWPQIGMCRAVYGPNAHQWRRVNWTTSHRNQAGSHWFEFIDDLTKEAEAEGLTPDDIRIVFYFDS